MYKIYQVGNETLSDIAKKINTTVENLEMLNGISAVIPGSYIIIPTENNNSDYTTYIVKQGDNMYAIARMYGVDYETLLKLNGLNKDDYIYPNQELMIPTSKTYVTSGNETINEILNKLQIEMSNIKNIGDLYLLKDQIIKF